MIVAERPLDPPEPRERYEPDPDAEYDLFRERVDRGEMCPTCWSSLRITQAVVRTISQFTCGHCGGVWQSWTERGT